MEFKPEKLPKWIETKPKLLVLLTALSLASAQKLFDWFKDPNDSHRKSGLNSVPPSKLWLYYYDVENIDIMWICKWFFEELRYPPFARFVIVWLQYVQRRAKALKRTPDLLSPIFNSDIVIEFANWLEGVDLKELLNEIEKIEIKNRNNRFDNNPLAAFVLRVYYPCIFFYGETPGGLFKEAQNGDFEALCNLVKIDRLILNDKKISKIFSEISLNNESMKFSALTHAMQTPLKINSPKKIKELLAVFNSEIAKFHGVNLSAPQINNLLDLIAQIKDDNALIDTDFESPATFAKQIKRKAPRFRNLLKLDKIVS